MTVTTTSGPADGGTPVLDGTPLPLDPAGMPYASWTRRVVGALLDAAVLSGATWLVLGPGGLAPDLTPGFATPDPVGTPTAWTTSPVLVVLVLAMLALQGYTGATPGKRVAGVAVVRADTRLPAGFLVSVLRVVAHLLDAILLVGYLRPLWNAERRTFADSILGTVALQTREPPPHPWFARFRHAPDAGRSTVVSVAAGLVCVLGVGFSMTSTEGGATEETVATCTVTTGTPGDAPVTVTVTQVHSWELERRLWVAREVAQTSYPLDARWDWADDPDAAARLEATISTPGGGDPWTAVQEPAEPSGTTTGATTWPDDGPPGPDTVRVPGTVVDRYPGGWTYETRLLVDGEVVAGCGAASPEG